MHVIAILCALVGIALLFYYMVILMKGDKQG